MCVYIYIHTYICISPRDGARQPPSAHGAAALTSALTEDAFCFRAGGKRHLGWQSRGEQRSCRPQTTWYYPWDRAERLWIPPGAPGAVLAHRAGHRPRIPSASWRNHRIVEWFGLEGTLKIIWFQPPCHEQGHLPPDQVAQSSIQPGLEHCQGGGSHSFSGQPGPGPHHPHGEEFLPYI